MMTLGWPHLPKQLYDEMTVKLTRRGQLMLTLSIVLPGEVDAPIHRHCGLTHKRVKERG